MYNNRTMSEQSWSFDKAASFNRASAKPQLTGWLLVALRLAWIALALVALAIFITSLPGYLTKFSGQLAHTPASQATAATAPLAVASGIASLTSALLSFALAGLLFKRRFDEPAAASLAFYLVLYSVILAGPWEHWEYVWLDGRSYATVLQSLLMSTPTFALFAFFPNGRIRPSWMRWVVLASIPLALLMVIFNPYKQPLIARDYIILGSIFIVLIAASMYAQIWRFRHDSSEIERQQTKWVVFGFSLWFAYILFSSIPYFYLTSLPAGAQVPWWAGMSELFWWLSLSIVPLSLTIAITRYKLWNIDIVINRSLVYGGLALSLVAIYLVLIASLGFLFQTSDNLLIPLIATGAAVLLFQPLRVRLQSGVNRMMYGQRDEPATVLNKLSQQLEGSASAQDTLAAIVETIGTTLKLPYVAIEFGQQGQLVARYGRSTDEPYRLPLLHQGEQIGHLLAAPRPQQGKLSDKDLAILETICRQTGVVAYNASLTADLLRTRQRLVTMREEERRRIRRDLHDGLGPQLASLNLKLEAAENLLKTQPEQAVELLDESKAQIKDAVADIRRLVYNLRPPALDELGLMASLRQRAATFSSGQGMQVLVEGPHQLDELPAAVEVAVYRISEEAINNAGQHANADHCWLRLQAGRELSLIIEDDGQGLPVDHKAGVGILSMRERTEELGGEFTISARQPQGTRIEVSLPLQKTGDI